MVFLGFAAISCEPEYQTSNSDLSFDRDTLVLDTTFAYLGSPTNSRLRLNNSSKHPTEGVVLRLAGGAGSIYTINVNGESGTYFDDLSVRGKDSLFVFVQIKPFEFPTSIDNGVHLLTDSIIIESGPYVRKVVLSTPIIHADIKSGHVSDEIWESNRYILVTEDAIIPANHQLTVEPGCNVNFRANAGLIVEGSLVVNGECGSPVLFRGHRHDYLTSSVPYTKVPDQWKGIWLKSGSQNNLLNHSVVRNASIGIQVGEQGKEGSDLELNNCRLLYNGEANVIGYNAQISMFNCVLSNSIDQVRLFGGGVDMVHTTIANYNEWNQGKRGFALYLADKDEDELEYAFAASNISNSIIYGWNAEELFFSSEDIPDFFTLENSIVRTDYFPKSTTNTNPQFRSLDRYKYDFRLTKSSPAIDAGGDRDDHRQEYDVLCHLRDFKPDIGAYEYVDEEGYGVNVDFLELEWMYF
ncbi:hypothetical protein [Geofilum rubicundum]|uniref:hypothetical protein n=1 Tax=Geofilum rubicundum TaxID=472113 RepID=UPI0012F7EE57|nr:hypothetical protein [Geofilum rubicundum]